MHSTHTPKAKRYIIFVICVRERRERQMRDGNPNVSAMWIFISISPSERGGVCDDHARERETIGAQIQ